MYVCFRRKEIIRPRQIVIVRSGYYEDRSTAIVYKGYAYVVMFGGGGG